MKEKLINVKLQCDNTTLNTHIEHRFKKKTIKPGMLVELKDDTRIWTVKEVYGEPIEKSSIKRGWNNNI